MGGEGGTFGECRMGRGKARVLWGGWVSVHVTRQKEKPEFCTETLLNACLKASK